MYISVCVPVPGVRRRLPGAVPRYPPRPARSGRPVPTPVPAAAALGARPAPRAMPRVTARPAARPPAASPHWPPQQRGAGPAGRGGPPLAETPPGGAPCRITRNTTSGRRSPNAFARSRTEPGPAQSSPAPPSRGNPLKPNPAQPSRAYCSTLRDGRRRMILLIGESQAVPSFPT